MAKRIVEAIGWQIRIAGDGSIRISAPPATESAKFDVFEGDAIEPALTHTYDWYSCPNCLRVVSGDSTAEARDDDPDSALSTVTRGREIWKQEKSVTLGDRETLAAYAQRRLKELSKRHRGRSITSAGTIPTCSRATLCGSIIRASAFMDCTASATSP